MNTLETTQSMMMSGVVRDVHLSRQEIALRIVVSYPPGSGTDIVALLLAQKMTENLGQQVIADNKPGAIVGVEAVARARPPWLHHRHRRYRPAGDSLSDELQKPAPPWG